MVEQRAVPREWTAHWKFDGVDAYIALVATERDDEHTIASRLISPLTALAFSTRGSDVPRWFAEGVGSVTAARKVNRDPKQQKQLKSEMTQAIRTMKDAKSFLGGKMSPQDTDRIGSAVANTLLNRGHRRKFSQLLRRLDQGGEFNAAFTAVFGAAPEAFVSVWMTHARR